MTIHMVILNTLIFALGPCGVRLSRARGGDTVRGGTCSTTTGRHGAQPQLDEETSLGVDSGCSYSSQDLEQQVGSGRHKRFGERLQLFVFLLMMYVVPTYLSSTACRTSTAQQAMPAYARSTVALNASSSTQAGGYPYVVLDSGACFHITGFGEALQNPEHITGSVFGISGTPLPVTGQGSIMGTPFPIWLDKVRYAQGLPRLLVSVSQLTTARSARVIFEPDFCRVERMSDNCTIGQGRRVGDLYTLDCLTTG